MYFFILFITYEVFYDIISLKYVDLVSNEFKYSVCIKNHKTSRGFGSNFVLIRNISDCDQFVQFKNKNFTNRELYEFVKNLKSQSK